MATFCMMQLYMMEFLLFLIFEGCLVLFTFVFEDNKTGLVAIMGVVGLIAVAILPYMTTATGWFC